MAEIKAEICIGQLKIKHRPLVANFEHDFILGMDLISYISRLTVDPVERVVRLDNKEFILNQRCIKSKPVRLIPCQNEKVRRNAETIVPVRVDAKPEFALGIIQPTHTPKKILMIANALVSTDCDILVLVANVFPKAMNIKAEDVLGVCEPVTKIFHHNQDLSDSNDEKIKSNLEIPALERGYLTEHQRKVARKYTETQWNVCIAQKIRQASRSLRLAK
ncbi:hypothetical protein Zmor_018459 [Zophobas morio]|uniref:Uncharacterized protein n=1 Tax=Zophobas morio TaxID=2755281 RepID=A0AA38IBP7_9CUCU|nr:hypothetical protein Zmor_018459 [Zophobas morio]